MAEAAPVRQGIGAALLIRWLRSTFAIDHDFLPRLQVSRLDRARFLFSGALTEPDARKTLFHPVLDVLGHLLPLSKS